MNQIKESMASNFDIKKGFGVVDVRGLLKSVNKEDSLLLISNYTWLDHLALAGDLLEEDGL